MLLLLVPKQFFKNCAEFLAHDAHYARSRAPGSAYAPEPPLLSGTRPIGQRRRGFVFGEGGVNPISRS